MAKTEKTTIEPETNTARRRRLRRESQQVALYSEVSVTVCVDRQNNNFIKITIGHERLSPSDSETDLKKTEAAAFKFNEAIVDRRVTKVKRLIQQIEASR